MSASRWLPPDPDAHPSVAPASVAPPGFVPSTQPSAGWYADPQGRGQRYWDGTRWTDQLAPYAPSAAPSVDTARTGDWVGGVLLSLLMPIVGLIAGVVYVAKGGEKQRVGVMCIVLSCVAFFAWLLIVSMSNSATY
jgi:hypothetical protein